jgi:type I restriction enzyme M protein
MPPTFNLADLLRDSDYKLTQFQPEQIKALEASVTLKESAKSTTTHVMCLVRGKSVKLAPEEAVRQLYIMVLRDNLVGLTREFD